MQKLSSIMRAAVDRYNMIEEGDRIAVGVSGGKDSSVVAALLVEALGKDNVVGVLMPKGEQFDIDVSIALCEFLDIKYYTVNINDAYNGLMKELEKSGVPVTTQAVTNLPPRIRMSTVYAVSQSVNGRVANTCNLSEDWVGYSTRYGDAAGDFSPLSKLTVQEVKEVGRELGLADRFVDKVPIDGLCGKTDEDNLGFTYAVLDKYIRTGVDRYNDGNWKTLAGEEITEFTKYVEKPAKRLAIRPSIGVGYVIINGKPEKLLDPKGVATRAEAAAMLRRYHEMKNAEPSEN